MGRQRISLLELFIYEKYSTFKIHGSLMLTSQRTLNLRGEGQVLYFHTKVNEIKFGC